MYPKPYIVIHCKLVNVYYIAVDNEAQRALLYKYVANNGISSIIRLKTMDEQFNFNVIKGFEWSPRDSWYCSSVDYYKIDYSSFHFPSPPKLDEQYFAIRFSTLDEAIEYLTIQVM